MMFLRRKKREASAEAEFAAKQAERAQRAKERVEQRIAALEQAVRDDQAGPGGPDDTAGAVRIFKPHTHGL